MRPWPANTRDTFTTQLWSIPTIAVVAALLIGLGLPELDSAVNQHLSGRVSGLLFGGDADAARSLLGASASSLITVTALTFSLTVVALQLASSQFSPRLLRTFTSDQFVHATLALFLATFTLALTGLRAVRSAGDSGQAEFVPKFAVTLAFLLAVASVLGLVLFLAHLTAQIRVETMLRRASRRLENDARSASRARPRRRRPTSRVTAAPRCGATARPRGRVPDPDQAGLPRPGRRGRRCAAESRRLPGQLRGQGHARGCAWPVAGGRFDEETAERVADLVAGCLHTGFERTASQDVGYGLRQLADVANKALSPGINDPTTAIHALGHISAFLCDLTGHDLGPQLLRDQDDRVRVTMHCPDLAAYVDLGISQPRRYG
ncbi:MAG: DUF2254 domain-containing protein, partial [Nocardioides sp.]|nr:DUF2254 domain-containing protein [Nocardioides sp.]